MGKIWDLKEQPEFVLIPKQDGERACLYRADFSFHDADGLHVQDVKSEHTRKLPLYVMKRKLLRFLYGIKIEEV